MDPTPPPRPTPPSRIGLSLRALNPIELFFGPVFQREVRVLGRKKGTYWTRGAYALVLFAFCALFYIAHAIDGQRLTGAARLQQFQGLAPMLAATIAWSQLVAVVLIAPLLTGPLICDEKRNRTISALATSPLSALHIIFGGLLSRLVQLAILILIAAPLMLALRAFGGLDVILILGVTALTASAGILAAALGVWGSVHARKPWNGAAFAFLTLVILSFLPIIFWALNGVYPGWGFMQASNFAANFTTFFAMFALSIPDGVRGMPFGGPDLWINVTLGNLALAGLCCLIAAIQLRRVLTREAAETPSGAATGPQSGRLSPRDAIITLVRHLRAQPALRLIVGLITIVTAVIFLAVAYSERDAWDIPMILAAWIIVLGSAFCMPTRKTKREVSDMPIYWRESQQSPFGSPLIALAAAMGAALILALAYANGGLLEDHTALPLVAIGSVILCLHTAAAASGSIAGEVQTRTWSSLLTTPLSSREIIRGKVFGLARRQWLVPAVIIGHLVLVWLGGRLNPMSLLIVIAFLTCGLIFLSSLGVLTSLYFRRATPAAVWTLLGAAALWAVLPGMVAFIATILNWDSNSSPAMAALTAVISANPIFMAVCAVEGGMHNDVRFDMPNGRTEIPGFSALSILGCATLLGLAFASRRVAERYFPVAAAADR